MHQTCAIISIFILLPILEMCGWFADTRTTTLLHASCCGQMVLLPGQNSITCKCRPNAMLSDPITTIQNFSHLIVLI